MSNQTQKSISIELEQIKQKLVGSLPEASTMVQRAIDMCLDNIRNGVEPDYYRSVLKKLIKINTRPC
jgi:hypothetical protein